MTDKERDHILTLLEKGLEANEIGEMFNRSGSVVRLIHRVWLACKNGEIAEAKRMADSSRNVALFQWACRRNGINPDQTPDEEKPKEEPEKAVTAATIQDIEDAIHVLDGKQALRLDQLLAKLDQLAVILQSCTVGIKEGINANADILNRELMKHSETLNGIKSNTRRKFDNRIE